MFIANECICGEFYIVRILVSRINWFVVKVYSTVQLFCLFFFLMTFSLPFGYQLKPPSSDFTNLPSSENSVRLFWTNAMLMFTAVCRCLEIWNFSHFILSFKFNLYKVTNRILSSKYFMNTLSGRLGILHCHSEMVNVSYFILTTFRQPLHKF